MSRSPLLDGLPPIADARARVLILGNMPSAMSLAAGEYYANPRNAFWRIAADLFGFEADDPYPKRTEALRRQGADPEIGRRLGELFTAEGLQTTVGMMAAQWRLPGSPDAEFEAEWKMREHDLAGLISAKELRHLRSVDRQALEEGRRVLFVPTFYALGRRPAVD